MDRTCSPSSSSQNNSLPSLVELGISLIHEKCRVCDQPGHGFHFGAFTCRACSAFFRRAHFSLVTERKCRLSNGRCVPTKGGRWFCKKCRLAKCSEAGMNSRNIQYDRDANKTSLLSSTNVNRNMKNKNAIPNTVESLLGISNLIILLENRSEPNACPVVDISLLVDKATNYILNPVLIRKDGDMSNLEQLSLGLQDIQSSQKENVLEKKFITIADHMKQFEKAMCATAKWLACSKKIQSFDDDVKIKILRTVWFNWGRLEHMTATAKMRIRGSCGKEQLMFSSDTKLNFGNVHIDLSCFSKYSFEQMRYFFSPNEVYYDEAISKMVEMQPSDIELTYLICAICFHITGKHFGGDIEEEMGHLQDVLASDLHDYYCKNNFPMYLLRLKQLLKIKDTFVKLRNIRLEKYEIGGVFKVINMEFSQCTHQEYFHVPC
ncbi:NR LBD domain-containing protein [Caenorhabditis elegans]|uniref:NR LBD domain-containing protein n=2 Tax=Caenorhabditis elegans TaxID=6239 RepID=A0A0K3AXP8_CAEEL|nr:NR LBD domain-containing protein [Caenorhabditis elegans]CTQ86773.1 NR LBD domain-containing protein [Caenorhabditis elegans]|eukprot:NP_001300074.1 Nuclear Hormone Receptor family [Caenorhabditis elegans]